MAQQPSLTSYSYNSSLKVSTQSLKIKVHVEGCVLRYACCIVRALSNAKYFLTKFLILTTLTMNKKTSNNYIMKMNRGRKMKKILKSIIAWCNCPSSHVISMLDPTMDFQGCNEISKTYYDSTWNSIVVINDDDDDDKGLERQLSGYLEWLEERSGGGSNNNNNISGNDMSEIDQLAEKFIANCHEKFRLEKQESYRRYQEMLARNM